MTIRYIARICTYVTIFALFAALAVQFFAGDLGIYESNKKQRAIAALKADIAALEYAAAEKHAEIEKLTHDMNVIRFYANLYNMTGGRVPAGISPQTAADNAAGEEMDAADAAYQQTQSEAAKPFLLRYPILIVLLGGIAVSSIALFTQIRVQARKNQDRQKNAYAR